MHVFLNRFTGRFSVHQHHVLQSIESIVKSQPFENQLSANLSIIVCMKVMVQQQQLSLIMAVKI